jgi:hypothetical protein
MVAGLRLTPQIQNHLQKLIAILVLLQWLRDVVWEHIQESI